MTTLSYKIKYIIEDSPFLSGLKIDEEALALKLKSSILDEWPVTEEWQLVLLLADVQIVKDYEQHLIERQSGGSSSRAEQGINIVDKKDEHDRNALHFAALSGNVQLIEYVVGEYEKKYQYNKIHSKRDKANRSAIYYAAAASSAACLRRLFEYNPLGVSFYSFEEHRAGASLLLPYALANADRETEDEDTAIKYLKIAEYKGRMTIDNISNVSPLHCIARSNNVGIFNQLRALSNPQHPQVVDDDKRSAFHIAALHGNLEMFQALEALCSGVTIKLNSFVLPILPLAVRSGNVAMVKYLIEEKEVELKDNSPYFEEKIIRPFAERPSPEPDKYLVSLLYHALLSGNEEMVTYIQSRYHLRFSTMFKFLYDDPKHYCLVRLNALHQSGNLEDFKKTCYELFKEIKDPNFLKDWVQYYYAHLCNDSLDKINFVYDAPHVCWGMPSELKKEVETFFRTLGSFLLYHAVFEVNRLNDLGERYTRGGIFHPAAYNPNYHKIHEKFLRKNTAFFILHYLFVSKNQDGAYQIAFDAFSTLISQLKNAKVNYEEILNAWQIPNEIKNHQFGYRLEVLKTIPEPLLKRIIPEYLVHLEKPVYVHTVKVAKEQAFIEKLNEAINLVEDPTEQYHHIY